MRAIRREAIPAKDPRIKSLWDLLRQRGLLARSPWLKGLLLRCWQGLPARERPRTTRRLVARLRAIGILPPRPTRVVAQGPVVARVRYAAPIRLTRVGTMRPSPMTARACGSSATGRARDPSLMTCHRAPSSASAAPATPEVSQGVGLYQAFNQFAPARLCRVRHNRVMPAVVVHLGDLVGLIYRSDKWRPGKPRTYIHFMDEPPRLVSDTAGHPALCRGWQLSRVGARHRGMSVVKPDKADCGCSRSSGAGIGASQQLGLDELMIVNPSSGAQEPTPRAERYFLGEDGTLYRADVLGAGGPGRQDPNEAGSARPKALGLGSYFLGADGTLYEVVE